MGYKKVALIALPKQDLFRPPAALPILAAACEEKNIDYTINDFNLWLNEELDLETWQKIDDNWSSIDSYAAQDKPWFTKFRQTLNKYVTIILDQQCDLIAISVFTDWSAHCAVEMIQNIRKKNREVKIVIGGTGIGAVLPALSLDPMCSWLLNNKLIDYYIYGEGEIAFRQLLDNDINNPGINNFNFEQIANLNQFPNPSYKKINISGYKHTGVPSLIINGSRGCVRHCTYCDVAKYWPQFRYKDGKNLAQEIYATWKTTGVTDYEFSDSLINGSVRDFRNLNNELIRLKDLDPEFCITYKGQFICRAPEQFTENDYRLMKNAGCDYIYVGVETFSEKVRLDMLKKFDNHALDFHLEQCAKFGIPNVFLMIVGYPTETDYDHRLNLEGLRKYQIYSKAGIVKMITFGITTSILKDTPLYLQQEHMGIVPEFEDFNVTSNWISMKNPTLTFEKRVERWIELTELANNLGYNQPRIDPIIKRLSQTLIQCRKKQKNQIIPIKTL